jgi:serine/threonine protein kinase
MGEVWAAWDESLDRDVAIKMIRGSLVDNDQFRNRFLAEARRQARLSHPNIPRVYDHFTENGASCLVLQRIDGRSLQSIVDTGGALEIPRAISIAGDVLSALDYAHQRGIIHRDVKPSNIIVDHDGRGHLIDFGISVAVGEARFTKTGAFVGTFEYSSPEQIRQPQHVDHRTDVYSAGCVLYEMLTGRPPFIDSGSGSGFHIQQAQVFEKPKSLRQLRPHIPQEIDNVVLWSLEKNVETRLSGCSEFSRLLTRALEAETAGKTTVRPDSETAKPGAPPRSHAKGCLRLLFRTVLVVVVSMVLLVVIAYLISR